MERFELPDDFVAADDQLRAQARDALRSCKAFYLVLAHGDEATVLFSGPVGFLDDVERAVSISRGMSDE